MSVPKTRPSSSQKIELSTIPGSKEETEAKPSKLRSNTPKVEELNPAAASKEEAKSHKIRGNDKKTDIAAPKEGSSRVTTTAKKIQEAEVPETLIKAPVYNKILTEGSIQWDYLPSNLVTLGNVYASPQDVIDVCNCLIMLCHRRKE